MTGVEYGFARVFGTIMHAERVAADGRATGIRVSAANHLRPTTCPIFIYRWLCGAILPFQLVVVLSVGGVEVP